MLIRQLKKYMRFGINIFLFACPFTNKSTRLFPLFKKWGFETVEISYQKPSDFDPVFVKDQLPTGSG